MTSHTQAGEGEKKDLIYITEEEVQREYRSLCLENYGKDAPYHLRVLPNVSQASIRGTSQIIAGEKGVKPGAKGMFDPNMLQWIWKNK